jgi:predicted hotdog family 3-hydroxylacyl-ACP dehydratase
VASPPPDLTAVEGSGPELRARGRVPDDLPHFAGHFPGEPILPGVVQLEWVLALARDRLGMRRAPSALEAIKFREPLRPGQDFEISLAWGEDLHFELASRGRPVSAGRVRFDEEPPQHAPQPPASAVGRRWPLALPHAAPMRFVERVLDHAAGETTCAAAVPESALFCEGGRAPAWLALELLAQGMAAQGSLAVEPGSRLRGLLVGCRRLELRTRAFAAGEPLWVHVRHVRGTTGLVACECALGVGKLPGSASDARAAALACGALTAFVESAKD